MSDSYYKICSLLAAAELNEREAYEFYSAIQTLGPDEFYRSIKEIRNFLRNTDFRYRHDMASRFHGEQEFHSETENKIEHLLLVEANLQKNVAISLLTGELEKLNRHVDIPAEGRKGFVNWIRRLSSIFSDSELLHVATRIRNEFVHNPSYDWRLK